MITPANHAIARARGLWYFKDVWNIFLSKIGEHKKKVSPLNARSPGGTVPYLGKSGFSYCITFIKRLDEGLR